MEPEKLAGVERLTIKSRDILLLRVLAPNPTVSFPDLAGMLFKLTGNPVVVLSGKVELSTIEDSQLKELGLQRICEHDHGNEETGVSDIPPGDENMDAGDIAGGNDASGAGEPNCGDETPVAGE